LPTQALIIASILNFNVGGVITNGF